MAILQLSGAIPHKNVSQNHMLTEVPNGFWCLRIMSCSWRLFLFDLPFALMASYLKNAVSIQSSGVLFAMPQL
jgi:hypothetical protein